MIHVTHVALWTLDLDESASFWATYFGATVGPLYASARRVGFTSRFVTLSSGASIELMSGPWLTAEPGPPADRVGWAHVAVSVGSQEAVRTLAARLDADGLLLAQPRTTGDGFYEALARAPDGALVEITA